MLLPQGDRHMEAVETQGAPKQTAVSSSAHPGRCCLQRCGAWDQSGFRQEMQPFTSPGLGGGAEHRGSFHPYRAPGDGSPGTTLQMPVENKKKFAWY